MCQTCSVLGLSPPRELTVAEATDACIGCLVAVVIRIFWKIAITFLTLAQNPFNYSKRFNIILEINEGKLVHNYGNFNYKYMYFLKKCIFLRIFI